MRNKKNHFQLRTFIWRPEVIFKDRNTIKFGNSKKKKADCPNSVLISLGRKIYQYTKGLLSEYFRLLNIKLLGGVLNYLQMDLESVNSFFASGDFHHLLKTFVNILDQDRE